MIDGRPTYQFKSWSFASAHTELFGDKSLSKHAYTLLEKQTPTKITHPLHQNYCQTEGGYNLQAVLLRERSVSTLTCN